MLPMIQASPDKQLLFRINCDTLVPFIVLNTIFKVYISYRFVNKSYVDAISGSKVNTVGTFLMPLMNILSIT